MLRVLEHRNTQHVSFSFRASWGTPLMLGQMRARLVPISIPRRCPWPHLAPWIARQKALIPFHPIFILYSSIFCFHLLHYASVWHFAICNWWCVLCRFCIGLSQSASQLFSLFPLALALECCWLDVTLCALILGELTHGLWCRLPRLLKLGLLKWWTACTSILPWLSA